MRANRRHDPVARVAALLACVGGCAHGGELAVSSARPPRPTVVAQERAGAWSEVPPHQLRPGDDVGTYVLEVVRACPGGACVDRVIIGWELERCQDLCARKLVASKTITSVVEARNGLLRSHRFVADPHARDGGVFELRLDGHDDETLCVWPRADRTAAWSIQSSADCPTTSTRDGERPRTRAVP